MERKEEVSEIKNLLKSNIIEWNEQMNFQLVEYVHNLASINSHSPSHMTAADLFTLMRTKESIPSNTTQTQPQPLLQTVVASTEVHGTPSTPSAGNTSGMPAPSTPVAPAVNVAVTTPAGSASISGSASIGSGLVNYHNINITTVQSNQYIIMPDPLQYPLLKNIPLYQLQYRFSLISMLNRRLDILLENVFMGLVDQWWSITYKLKQLRSLIFTPVKIDFLRSYSPIDYRSSNNTNFHVLIDRRLAQESSLFFPSFFFLLSLSPSLFPSLFSLLSPFFPSIFLFSIPFYSLPSFLVLSSLPLLSFSLSPSPYSPFPPSLPPAFILFPTLPVSSFLPSIYFPFIPFPPPSYLFPSPPLLSFSSPPSFPSSPLYSTSLFPLHSFLHSLSHLLISSFLLFIPRSPSSFPPPVPSSSPPSL